jgi:hypothetical protein
VVERTRDIKAMLRSTHIGILSIDRDLRIHPSYTAYLEHILEDQDFAAKDFVQVFLKRINVPSETLDNIITAVQYILDGDSLAFEVNQHVLPLQVEFSCASNRKKTLELDWVPISQDQEQIDRLMLSISDVTETFALRSETEKLEEELEIISEILQQSGPRVHEVQNHIRDYLEQLDQLIRPQLADTHLDKQCLRSIYIILHTLKGVVRTQRFRRFAQSIHETEELVKGKQELNVEEWQGFCAAHKRLKDQAALYFNCYNKLLAAS